MMSLGSQGKAAVMDIGQVLSSDSCACADGGRLDRWLELHEAVGCVRKREQGIEGHDDPEFAAGCIRHTEPCEQQRWCDYVADAAHLELCPILCFDSVLELCQHVAAEFREDGRHGFRRHLRPELMGLTEQRHQCTSWSIHVQDASGRGKYDHARGRRRKKGLLHRTCFVGDRFF